MFVGWKINQCVGERRRFGPVKWGFSQYSANPIHCEYSFPFAVDMPSGSLAEVGSGLDPAEPAPRLAVGQGTD